MRVRSCETFTMVRDLIDDRSFVQQSFCQKIRLVLRHSHPTVIQKHDHGQSELIPESGSVHDKIQRALKCECAQMLIWLHRNPVMDCINCSKRCILFLSRCKVDLGIAVTAPMGDPHAVVPIQVLQCRFKEAALPSPEL